MRPELSKEAYDGEIPSSDLLRRCGHRLTDIELWDEFQKRFQRRIFLYLLRACRVTRGQQDELREVVLDLAQEVYVRLVQNDGRILRSFRGQTEFAVKAFLARIATSVVADHFRYQMAEKRQAQVISIDQARENVETSRVAGTDFDEQAIGAVLSWIDIDRVLRSDGDRRNAARNFLIFKLHYVDGFTSAELSEFPGFALSVSGVEAVLNRIRKRLRQ